MSLRITLQKHRVQASPQGTTPAVAAGALLFGLTLIVFAVASHPVTAAGPTAVSGPITVPTTWTLLNSPYIVTGDVTIEGGGVLTIEPGVEVRFDAGTQLRVRTGPLYAEGTSTQPITFTANTAAPSRGYWDGILLDDTSLPSALSHCVVQYAVTGVAGGDTDSHTIEYCTVRHNGDGTDWSSGGGIHFAGDELTIANNLVYDNELGLRLRKSFSGVITGNQIYDNDLFGIGFIALGAPGGGDNLVAGNQIHDNGIFGLGFFAQGGYGGGSNNRVVNNQIYDNRSASGYPGNGLYLDLGSNNIVTGNLIYGNEGDGVWASSQTALQFTDNIVRGNGRSGFTYASANSAPASIHSNVLCGNAGYQLQNQWTTGIVAEGNWFGTQTPALGSEVSGPVDFDPWIVMDMAAVPDHLPADGISTATLTLTMRDGAGHAVPDGYLVDLSASEGTVVPSQLALYDGQATAVYQAGTALGAVTIRADDGCATITTSEVLTLEAVLDLAVTKAASGLIVGPDKDYFIEYTITVSNVGQLAASSVVLTDVLPAGTAYDGDDWTCQDGTCSLDVGLMVPSATAQFSLPLRLIKGTLDCPVVLTNTVQVTDTVLSEDARPENNLFTLTTVLDVPCLPDLFVVKNDNVGPEADAFADWVFDLIDLVPQAPDQRLCVRPGEWITYSIAYGNTGLVTATQGVLTETVPEYTNYVGGGWTCGGDVCTLELSDLPPGTGGVVDFVVEVETLPPERMVVNTVRIGSAEGDLNPDDNISSDDTPICEVCLEVSKDDNLPCAFPGDEIRYTMVYTNSCEQPLSGVVLTETLPANTSYLTTPGWQSLGGDQYVYEVGSLSPYMTGTVEFAVVVDDPLPEAVTETVDEVCLGHTGAVGPDDCDTVTTPLPLLADLRVVKHDHIGPPPDAAALRQLDRLYQTLYGQPFAPPPLRQELEPVGPGDVYSYTITYLNLGRAPATGVVLTETLPVHTSYVGYGWTPMGDGTYVLQVGDLGIGQGGQVNFWVRVTLTGCSLTGYLYNWVRIGGDVEECNLNNNWSGEETPVELPPCQGVLYLPLVLRQAGPGPGPGEGYVSDVAVNPVTNRVYLASPPQDAVFAVNPTGFGSVIATIPVGDHPLGLAVVTTTNMIYAANLRSHTVTAIRGSDHTRFRDITVGVEPSKVAADSGEARVYVAHHREIDNGAAAIDSLTNEFLYYYTRMHATQGRYGIDVDPVHNRLFIAARDAGLIAIQSADQPDLDPQVVKLYPPRVPYVVAFNPTTGHLFVTAADDNLVVVLDPYGIEWNRGSWVFWQGRMVFLLDQANAGWIKEIPVGDGAEEGIAVNPRTGFVYVTNAEDDTMSVLRDDPDPDNIRWVTDVTVGDYPQGVDVNVETNLIYVGNALSRDLTEIDGATHTVVKTIPLY
jgi:uncharacterized repeat protein (TIGR01451 family)